MYPFEAITFVMPIENYSRDEFRPPLSQRNQKSQPEHKPLLNPSVSWREYQRARVDRMRSQTPKYANHPKARQRSYRRK